MANNMKVIPIRSGRSMIKQQQEIVELAFQNWLSRLGVLQGSPEDDFYRAHRAVMARGSRSPSTPARLLLFHRSGS